MELFQQEERPETEQDAPLAWRMRPKSLDEFEGQRHLLAHGKPLRRAIEEDRMASFIFY